jgi:NTE family protein
VSFREAVEEHGRLVRIAAGEQLFEEGDAGDTLFLVRTGRLVAEVGRGNDAGARVVGRGELIGELSVLTGELRSARVRALRDSELLELRAHDVDALLAGRPDLGIELARDLAHRLRRSRGIPDSATPRPATIAVLALEPEAPAAALAAELASGLHRHGPTALLDGDDVALEIDEQAVASEYGPRLDRLEDDHEHVVLAARLPVDDPWTAFSLRQADRVLAVAGPGRPAAWVADEPPLRGADVVLCGEPFTEPRAARWLDTLAARALHLVGAGPQRAADVARLARRLAGRSVGLVLSGGGARGFAHLGVWDELRRAGVIVDRVGGASMGAFVAGMVAMDVLPADMLDRCREEFVRRKPLNDYAVPRVALLRGAKGVAMLERTFGSTSMEELPRELYCVSVDLVTAREVVHRRGRIAPVVGASMCLPAILPPRARPEGLLVDGGVLDNLPVGPMAARGEGPVIAVDVTGPFRRPEGPGAPLPSLKETLIRAIGVGSVPAVAEARERADLLICPEVGDVGMLEWAALERMVQAGRVAARAALDGARL